jgi:hypothetical protein
MSAPGPLRGGLKTLLNLQIFLVVAMAAGLTWLAHRSQTSLADAAFASSIAVLVFLLPAAGLVGPFLVAETSDAVRLLIAAHRSQDIEYLRESVKTLINKAEPLRRAFVYSTLAVLISALALVEPTWKIKGFTATEACGATAIALLVNTALCVFPMTWELLQMKAVRALVDVVLMPTTEAQSATDASETPATPATPAEAGSTQHSGAAPAGEQSDPGAS